MSAVFPPYTYFDRDAVAAVTGVVSRIFATPETGGEARGLLNPR
jgi:hypothetical protein